MKYKRYLSFKKPCVHLYYRVSKFKINLTENSRLRRIMKQSIFQQKHLLFLHLSQRYSTQQFWVALWFLSGFPTLTLDTLALVTTTPPLGGVFEDFLAQYNTNLFHSHQPPKCRTVGWVHIRKKGTIFWEENLNHFRNILFLFIIKVVKLLFFSW